MVLTSPLPLACSTQYSSSLFFLSVYPAGTHLAECQGLSPFSLYMVSTASSERPLDSKQKNQIKRAAAKLVPKLRHGIRRAQVSVSALVNQANVMNPVDAYRTKPKAKPIPLSAKGVRNAIMTVRDRMTTLISKLFMLSRVVQSRTHSYPAS